MSNNNQNMTNNDNNGFGNQNMNDAQGPHGGNGSSLRDHLKLDRTIQPSCIIFPLIIWYFEIKSKVVQLLPKFHRMEKESLCLHLHKFEEVYTTISMQNINAKQLKLKLFSFSLKDKAKTWLYFLRPNLIIRWDVMQKRAS